VKYQGSDYPLTKIGEKTFAYGSANENPIVFVKGKSGKIELILTGLYAAKKQ
jgi:hypothetical protein